MWDGERPLLEKIAKIDLFSDGFFMMLLLIFALYFVYVVTFYCMVLLDIFHVTTFVLFALA